MSQAPSYFVDSSELLAQTAVDQFGEPVGLIIPQQRIVFHDESFLEFDLVVNDDLVPAEYSYHFQSDGAMVWRKDKHRGHERALGREEHLHDDPSNQDHRVPFELVEIDEVMGQVEQHFAARGRVAPAFSWFRHVGPG